MKTTILLTLLVSLTAHAQLPPDEELRLVDDSLAVSERARLTGGIITGLGVVGLIASSAVVASTSSACRGEQLCTASPSTLWALVGLAASAVATLAGGVSWLSALPDEAMLARRALLQEQLARPRPAAAVTAHPADAPLASGRRPLVPRD